MYINRYVFLIAIFFSFLQFNLAFFCLIFTSGKLYKLLIFNLVKFILKHVF